MSLMNVFDVSKTGLVAQTSRLNLISENIANADVESSTPEGAYRAQYPMFRAFFNEEQINAQGQGVRYEGPVDDTRAPKALFDPGNPKANDEGYVFMSNVNTVEEMSNMMSASRSYQTNVEVMNTAKQLLMRTLTLGQA